MRKNALMSALENLRSTAADPLGDITVVADCLNRNEINLLELKSAGLPREVIDACFLTSQCGDSIAPERLENLCVNPLARSAKAREIREELEKGDSTRQGSSQWDLARNSMQEVLKILENWPGERGQSEEMPRWKEELSWFSDDICRDME
jgi:hypothetical protein